MNDWTPAGRRGCAVGGDGQDLRLTVADTVADTVRLLPEDRGTGVLPGIRT